MIDLDQAITTAAVIAPFVIGLVEITKRVGLVDKYAGLVAIVYGLILSFLVASSEKVGELDGVDMWKRTAITGIIAGLTAAGAYSAVKAAGRDV
jgi:hypothetical protein